MPEPRRPSRIERAEEIAEVIRVALLGGLLLAVLLRYLGIAD